MTDPTQRTAYGAYVEYLLYTAEQMIASSPDWQAPMMGYMTDHTAYLCDPDGIAAQPGVTATLADMGVACTPQDRCG